MCARCERCENLFPLHYTNSMTCYHYEGKSIYKNPNRDMWLCIWCHIGYIGMMEEQWSNYYSDQGYYRENSMIPKHEFLLIVKELERSQNGEFFNLSVEDNVDYENKLKESINWYINKMEIDT